MKKIFTILVWVLITPVVFAQIETPFDFEGGEIDTLWILFANGAEAADKDIDVILNPSYDAVNGSDSVLQFIVRDDSNPWVGMYTDNINIMEFTEANHTLAMMVYKEKISPMRMKLERSLNGGVDYSVTMENTLTFEWELVKFKMVDAVNFFYQRLTVFPDFPATREGGTTVYIDNIMSVTEDNTLVKNYSGASMEIFPNPVQDKMSVQFPEMSSLVISDITGKQVRTMNFSPAGSKVVDISNLETGVYFITVKSAKGSYSMSFIKK